MCTMYMYVYRSYVYAGMDLHVQSCEELHQSIVCRTLCVQCTCTYIDHTCMLEWIYMYNPAKNYINQLSAGHYVYNVHVRI